MPKRKRETHDHRDPLRASKARKQSAQDYYDLSKKTLHRALKTSKGFERQKLGKRLKLAKAKSSIAEIERINREIEVLKGLDLDKVTEAHLNRCLLKVKVFKDCDTLPEQVRKEGWKPEGTEEMVVAGRNVVSGMCNMRQVKEVVEGVLEGMYGVLGVEKGVRGEKSGNGAQNGGTGMPMEIEEVNEDLDQENEDGNQQEPEWEGFSSSNEKMEDREIDSESEEDGAGDPDDMEYQSLSDTEITRFEALLGESSEEEGSDDDIWARIRASIPKDAAQKPFSPSVSISPEPQEIAAQAALDSDTESDLDSDHELSIRQPAKAKSKSKSKSKKAAPPLRAKTSTFLPTLMGGYWSGTDSSASDLEDSAPSGSAVRKNRPGQAARRAIWEKKYKAEANHIKSGQGSVADKKDGGWDPKRGAMGERGRGGRSGGRGGERGGRREGRGVTGGNNVPVHRKNAAVGAGVEKKRDDVGVLHPSWQAAKKAKTMEKTAKFEGKKMTFD